MKQIYLFFIAALLAYAEIAPKANPTIKYFHIFGNRVEINPHFAPAADSLVSIQQAIEHIEIEQVQTKQDEIKKQKEKFLIVINESSDPKLNEYAKLLNKKELDYFKRLHRHKNSFFQQR